MRTVCLSRVVANAAASLAAGLSLGWSSQVQGATPVAPSDFPRIVAYVRDGAPVTAIHPEKLTHINFAFARIDAQGAVVLPHPGVAPQLAQLRGLKARNPRLKILLSVGGWTADGFSDAAVSADSRLRFATSAVALLREHSLDGIDIDWEYPGQDSAGIKARPEDKQNFTLLLATLRAQLDASGPGNLLTIASADREYFDHTEMDKLHVYLDWINVMTYDFFNSMTSTTGHHAGLYRSRFAAETDRNGDAAVKQHLAAGIPAEKLVLGAAFYGRAFGGVNPRHDGLNQPYEKFVGAYPYAELAETRIDRDGFVRKWDKIARAPFLWNAASRTFISYDDPQSLDAKARYVRTHRLGGIMFWELSQDRDDQLLDAIVKGLRARRSIRLAGPPVADRD
jgi:chitinase